MPDDYDIIGDGFHRLGQFLLAEKSFAEGNYVMAAVGFAFLLGVSLSVPIGVNPIVQLKTRREGEVIAVIKLPSDWMEGKPIPLATAVRRLCAECNKCEPTCRMFDDYDEHFPLHLCRKCFKQINGREPYDVELLQ